jgi:hypothetical protein
MTVPALVPSDRHSSLLSVAKNSVPATSVRSGPEK